MDKEQIRKELEKQRIGPQSWKMSFYTKVIYQITDKLMVMSPNEQLFVLECAKNIITDLEEQKKLYAQQVLAEDDD